MSVKIRLTRTGKSHQISYRIAVQDTHTKRDGNFLEILGYYNPYNKPELEIDKEKLEAWIKKGAKPTSAVESLLKEGKLTKKVSKRKIARDKVKEDKAQAASEAAPAPAPEETPSQPTPEEVVVAAAAPAETAPDKASTDQQPKEEAKAEKKPAESASTEPEESKS